MKKLILVDGNSLTFKGFYATHYSGKWMKTKEGFPTNAIYSMANMLWNLIDRTQPDYLLIAFDTGKKTKRHEKFPEYKAGRAKAPEELFLQFPKIYEMIDAMGVKQYSKEGIEADDIIGTLAKLGEEQDLKTCIFSSDKDMLQLIDRFTSVHLTVKGVSKIDVITETDLENIYHLSPKQIIDLKGLMGDQSDNIPGVKGIGQKTATKLLMEYGNLETIYENINKIGGSTHDKLVLDKESAFMSKEIATIDTDCKLDISLKDIEFKGVNIEGFKEFLKKYEINSVLKRLP